ncbi:MAG: SUMF1/EgtB/PvdO family nonheme iron enzyme [Bacteroidota bacterium]
MKYLLLLIFLSTSLQSIANSRYKSTKRAYTEIISTTNKSLNVRVNYFDFWNDDVNHSALYLFFKGKNQSHDIESIELTTEFFEIKKTTDSKGFYLIPAKSNDSKNSVDLKIIFKENDLNVKPHCLEMVYIPKGEFTLGSIKPFDYRNTKSTSRGSLGAPLNAFFKSGTKGQFKGAYQINSENEIKLGDCEGCLNVLDAEITGVNTFSGNKKGVLPKTFPKGFESFYQMRYELTEQQFCDFLNSLSPEQAKERINLDATFQGITRADYGNFIEYNNVEFVTTKPNQPCSFLSWNDCLAYSDWAGIRVMTELEFEKSARGFDKPKFREFSWGGSEITKQYFLDKTLYKCDENNYCVDGNIHVNYLGFSNFNDVCTKNGSDKSYIGCRTLSQDIKYRGPLETGIHSKGKKSLNRVTTGSGYFGTLDLSGNLREPVIPIGSIESRNYAGSCGDGTITSEGKSDNRDWYYSNESDLVYGYRGGCWAFHENHARIADRFNVYRQGLDIRKPYSGYRGVKN